jgi:ABC-type dipeptide transport system, periplasmic component
MKRILTALLVVATVLTISSCGGGSSGTIVYGTTDKVSDMDTANAYDFHTWEIFQNINKGLLTYTPGTTEVVPGLAESYTVNDKGDEYTFKLRKGLKFTSGTAFNAQAVKWTIDRAVALKGDPSWLITDYVKEVQVVDDLTVKFILKGPTAFFPTMVAGCPPYFPLDPQVYPVDKVVKNPTELKGGALTGLGPYKVTSFKRDEEVVLQANSGYYGEKPKVSKVVIRYFADATTMRLALEKGEIDLAFKSMNPSDINDLSKNDKINTFKMPGPFIRYLTFNEDVSVFKDKKLRQAVSALIDRPEINDKVFLGQNAPLYSMVPQGMIYAEENFKADPGDANLAKAEALLKSAGYSAKKPFAFDLWYTPSHYGDTEVNMAEVVKAQLEKTPLIKVTLKSAEWATYKDQWRNKQMACYFLGWYPDYIDPDNYTAAFAGTNGSIGNGIFYSNKAWDDLFAKEQTVSDPKVRADIFSQVQKAWTTEVPTIPIFQGNLYVFTKKNIEGVKIGPTLIFNYDQLSFAKK